MLSFDHIEQRIS